MRPITTADVAKRPAPGTSVPTSIQFSPDGSTLTFLAADPGSLRRRLVAVDTETGRRREIPAPGVEVDEADLSIEERLRRERARELAVGVTRHRWASRAGVVLVPMGDGLWVLDDIDAAPRLAVGADDVPGPILDAQLSADGTLVGFVSADEVYVASTAGDREETPVQVTAGARDTGTTNGLAEYIAQEEMGRPYGFWLSPDGSHVAYCHVDETHIPVYRIMHQGSDDVGPGTWEDHRYPFAGEANATVRVGIVPSDGTAADSPVWLDLACSGMDDDRYVARVEWADDDTVLVQVENREQTQLDLLRFDRTTGQGSLVLRETSDVWINLHDLLRVRSDGSFVWASEADGFRHLELREADGTLVRRLTSGRWLVTGVAAIDDDHVWITATAESPLERHLYRVPLEGGEPVRLTREVGVHDPTVHPGTGHWVDLCSRLARPPTLTLRSFDDPDRVIVLADGADDPRVADLDLTPPTLRTVEAADGTELHAALYLPTTEGPHPTIVWVYGGPHAQLVTSSWTLTAQLRAQYLRQEGFCVAVADGRGSASRGLDFEGALRHRMGTVEVDDQVALVEALVHAGVADPDRVGIYGWSYGGYMSAMCLARRPDVFRSACAGAPVTSWDGYDTHYTERYMGTPQANPAGYADGSVMTHVEGLRGRSLLLVHGLIDENVHFRHTARLLNALLRADIDHELLLYPDERHVPRGEADRTSMEHRIADFFRTSLA